MGLKIREEREALFGSQLVLTKWDMTSLCLPADGFSNSSHLRPGPVALNMKETGIPQDPPQVVGERDGLRKARRGGGGGGMLAELAALPSSLSLQNNGQIINRSRAV